MNRHISPALGGIVFRDLIDDCTALHEIGGEIAHLAPIREGGAQAIWVSLSLPWFPALPRR